MSWVKIDDGAPDHRKQLAAGSEACWLWVCGLAYCNRQPARDGFIPGVKVGLLYPFRRAGALAKKLVEVGLWEEADGGYRVHDYHSYQPDQERAGEISKARSEAGRKGGLRSGKTRLLRSNLLEANEATNEARGQQMNEATANPVPTRPLSSLSQDLGSRSLSKASEGSFMGEQEPAETPPPVRSSRELALYVAKQSGILAPPADLVVKFAEIAELVA